VASTQVLVGDDVVCRAGDNDDDGNAATRVRFVLGGELELQVQ
jgi:hypothetical protein